MSFSTPKGEDGITVPKRGTRKSTRPSSENVQHASQASKVDMTDYDSIDLVGANDPNKTNLTAGETSTVIPLPFSDTPVITRNKELRKKGAGGARRSSLGMRGRRASSLIESGHSAIPHREVDATEFYKHIEAEGLTEPRRMKQLLTWTGERALGEKRAAHGDPDSGVLLAGRHQKVSICIKVLINYSSGRAGKLAERLWQQVRILRLVQPRRFSTHQSSQETKPTKP